MIISNDEDDEDDGTTGRDVRDESRVIWSRGGGGVGARAGAFLPMIRVSSSNSNTHTLFRRNSKERVTRYFETA